MAYAAVISLKQTIHTISNSFHTSTVQNKSIQHLYEDVVSLQQVLNGLDRSSSSINRKRVNALDGEIREALCEFEDVLESHLSDDQFQERLGGEEEIHHPLTDLQKLIQDFDSFTQKMKNLRATYIHELRQRSTDEEEEEVEDDYNDIDIDGNGCKMVGLSDQFINIKKVLMSDLSRDSAVSHVSLVGMGGIGKTTLAKQLLQDPLVSSHFERRAFVTLGPRYQLRGVMLDILRQLTPDEYILIERGEKIDVLERMVYESARNGRYLIVLDDVWDVELIEKFNFLLRSSRFNGTLLLVTTRLNEVAGRACAGGRFPIRFLDKKESWELLRHKVFDEMPCPHELQEPGKKIAENCEGLPLTIVTVADILSNADKTTQYWNEVADDEQHPVFVDAYDRMYKVLYRSYDYLDQYLRAFFLYMGVFPQKYEIPCLKLFDLWIAEGFPEPDQLKTQPYFAHHMLSELDSRNIVLVHKKGLDDEIKTCGLASPFWHLCNKEAAKNKFFRGINWRVDGLADLHGQRRLCIRKNVLFSIKDVYDSMGSVTTLRSLLCTGPYHQYPVPLCLEYLRSLRILDALTIRFYDFPVEALNLVKLIYLSLALNRNIPASISKLLNLHYLIVQRHALSIIESSDGNSSSYLPIEIWDMKQLEHLDVVGRNLPHPPNSEGSILPKLLTLLGVGPQTCTKDVLERIPNLRKLGVRIEFAPDDNNDEPLRFFDDISHLQKLEKLKCIIVNPNLSIRAPLSIFPPSLVELSLSGFGYPWKETSKISSLPNLKVLKLRCYAFRGRMWNINSGEFMSLELLLIEDSDLMWWLVPRDYHCPSRIRLKHCYRLKEMPTLTPYFTRIEIVDCSPAVVDWAKKTKEEAERKDYMKVVLNLHSSWD